MEDIVIVSGLPRSGTSLMMRMLAAGGLNVLRDDVRRADADNPRGYYEFEPAKRLREDASWLRQCRGKAVKIVYRLLDVLPGDSRYRVVFMHRDLHEVLASQRAMLNRQGQNVTADDKEMAALFERDLRRLEAWLRAQRHIRLLNVDYRQLVLQRRELVAKINTFLDGGLDEEAMCQVIEPSLYRHRSC